MLRILSIGNSFSQDAHRYLYKVAKSLGDEIYTVNYCIGGCSLERHWNEYTNDIPEYIVEVNGEYVRNDGALRKILSEEKFDAVTIQQVSQCAGKPETFEPYLGLLIEEIKKHQPQAKLFFQETWEYEYNTTHGGFLWYDSSCDKMYNAIRETCTEAAVKYGLTLIPSGELVRLIKKTPEFDSENGGISLYRDGFHMGLVYGRYMLACLWYKTILQKSPLDASYVPEDGESDPALLYLIRCEVDKYNI